jgi:hypothetical protein
VKAFQSAGPRAIGRKEAKVQHTESVFQNERHRERTANDEKTKRLRTLRLAKETADRLASENMAANKAG